MQGIFLNLLFRVNNSSEKKNGRRNNNLKIHDDMEHSKKNAGYTFKFIV